MGEQDKHGRVDSSKLSHLKSWKSKTGNEQTIERVLIAIRNEFVSQRARELAQNVIEESRHPTAFRFTPCLCSPAGWITMGRGPVL